MTPWPTIWRSTFWLIAAMGAVILRAETFDNAKTQSADGSVVKSCTSVVAQVIQIPNSNGLPAQVTRCLNEGETPRGAVVFLNGGPGAPPKPLPDWITTLALSAGYDVVSPLYSGTWSRPDNVPVKGSDFAKYDKITPAIRDVQDTLAWAKDRYPQVILGGSSAGGYLAAASCSGRCADGILMIAPLVQSPKELWDTVVKESTDIVALDKQDIRDGKGQAADLSTLSPNDAQNYRRFLAIGFYGQVFYERSLFEILSKADKSIPKLIIVGLDDTRIGINRLSDIRAHQVALGLYLVELPGIDHQTVSGGSSQPFIYSFFHDTRNKGKLANPSGECTAVKAGMTLSCQAPSRN